LSLGLASSLASVTLSEFIDLLKEQNMDLNINKEHVDLALKIARKVW